MTTKKTQRLDPSVPGAILEQGSIWEPEKGQPFLNPCGDNHGAIGEDFVALGHLVDFLLSEMESTNI